MIRIEYETTSWGESKINHVMFADTCDEAESICKKCEELGYTIIDVSNYIEEPDMSVLEI